MSLFSPALIPETLPEQEHWVVQVAFLDWVPKFLGRIVLRQKSLVVLLKNVFAEQTRKRVLIMLEESKAHPFSDLEQVLKPFHALDEELVFDEERQVWLCEDQKFDSEILDVSIGFQIKADYVLSVDWPVFVNDLAEVDHPEVRVEASERAELAQEVEEHLDRIVDCVGLSRENGNARVRIALETRVFLCRRGNSLFLWNHFFSKELLEVRSLGQLFQTSVLLGFPCFFSFRSTLLV